MLGIYELEPLKVVWFRWKAAAIYVHNTLTYTHTYTINRIILGWWYNRNTYIEWFFCKVDNEQLADSRHLHHLLYHLHHLYILCKRADVYLYKPIYKGCIDYCIVRSNEALVGLDLVGDGGGCCSYMLDSKNKVVNVIMSTVLCEQIGINPAQSTGTNRHIPTALACGGVTMGECV